MKTYRGIRGSHVFLAVAVSLSASPLWQLCRLREKGWYSLDVHLSGPYGHWLLSKTHVGSRLTYDFLTTECYMLQNCVGNKQKSCRIIRTHMFATWNEGETQHGRCMTHKLRGGQNVLYESEFDEFDEDRHFIIRKLPESVYNVQCEPYREPRVHNNSLPQLRLYKVWCNLKIVLQSLRLSGD
jgi:hypothetical protein